MPAQSQHDLHPGQPQVNLRKSIKKLNSSRIYMVLIIHIIIIIHFIRINYLLWDRMCNKMIWKILASWCLSQKKCLRRDNSFLKKICIWKNNCIKWKINWLKIGLKSNHWPVRIKNIRSSSIGSLKRKSIGMAIILTSYPVLKPNTRNLRKSWS